MIQFLRFDKSKEFDVEFGIVKGKEALRFFIKRTFYLILFVYSTLFLAVATPFVKTPSLYIYSVGALATFFYLIRFINHIVKFLKYKDGYIKLTDSFIEVKTSDKTIKLLMGEITGLEINPLGNLLIREKSGVISFPLVLIGVEAGVFIQDHFLDVAPKRTALFRKIWEVADAVVVALFLAVHINQYIVQAYAIPTGSMEDTLQVGDHLFVEKITYGPSIPKMAGMNNQIHLKFLGIRELNRRDIIIFTPPIESEKHKDYIKRCIALPGDEFHVKDNFVYINGVKQDEPYTLGKPTDYDNFIINSSNSIEGIVPQGKVVVLGDNRVNSADGRYFGYLDISAIKGRAFIMYWNTGQIFRGKFQRLGFIR